RHRLSVYHSQTKPLVDFYQKLSAAEGTPKYHAAPNPTARKRAVGATALRISSGPKALSR
ncbi:hypothetical protein NTA27_06380, partial [Pseudomonas aeruginosa]|nr:hypothetical protein [Pseudomonas aeruginosa]